MDQILRDAIDNRAPSPIRHILREDLDEILREGQAALSLADHMASLSKQTADSVQLREELLGKAKRPLMAELRELEERVMRNTASLHTAHQDRKLLVKQYWQWRHRVELGDVKAGATFEAELLRGPRFRHVGVQNVIQTEYLSQQVLWLKQLLRREETFRRHVSRIEALVNELKEMNQQVDYGLMCPVCKRMCVDPVALWPCGHSFCQGACLDSLQVSTYLHRCAVCFSVGSEGAIPNVLLAEIIAKWTVREKSYSDVSHSLDDVKCHMALFERDKVQQRLNALEFRARQVLSIGYCT
jgi:E3 ubiquitin-protein ligase RNF180